MKSSGILKNMFKMGIPMMVAQLINILYNIVDRLYITRMSSDTIPNIGSVAFSGLSVCLPVILILSSFSALVGAGGAPLAAIRMGENDKEGAQKLLKNSLILLILACAVVTIVTAVFSRQILVAFGAVEENLAYAEDYLNIYLVGSVFVFLALGLNQFLTAQRKSNFAMLTILIGAVLNIALDPLFIFTFNMGVKGAALATILSQAVSAVWVIIYLVSPKRELRLVVKNVKLDWKIVKAVIALGVSPFVMQVTEAFVQIAAMNGMRNYGGADVIAYQTTMGFLITITQMLIFPLLGFDQGVQALIGYHFGAGNVDMVKKITNRLFIITTSFLTLMFIVVMAASVPLTHIITNDPHTVELASAALKIQCGALFSLGVLFAAQTFFMGCGQAGISLSIACIRKIVLYIPFALLFPLIWGVDGVFIAQPVSDFITMLTAGTLYLVRHKKILTKRVRFLETRANVENSAENNCQNDEKTI